VTKVRKEKKTKHKSKNVNWVIFKYFLLFHEFAVIMFFKVLFSAYRNLQLFVNTHLLLAKLQSLKWVRVCYCPR